MNEVNGSLTETTRTLLIERVRVDTMRDIARASGINEHWLGKFRSGGIANPGSNRVQKLYEYLTGKKLKLTCEVCDE